MEQTKIRKFAFYANEIQNEQKFNQCTQALGLILAPVKKLPSGGVYT